MTTSEWINSGLTIIAIVVGPIAAVWYTRKLDRDRAQQDRRLWIFRALMGTRGIRLSNDHVTALNLVVVEYHDYPDIIAAFKEYIRHLNSSLPPVDEQDRFFEEREDIFTTMLRQMGASLGYNFDGRELERLSYAPIGWAQDEDRKRRVQALLIDVLQGTRPIGIASLPMNNQHSPFPPPPDSD